ncbi:hypothetical protein M432DRAFT_451937 [Thermoascus aurantiacus ATCC 26904]
MATKTFELSIGIFRDRTDPDDESHWGFIIHQPPNTWGELLHVELPDKNKRWLFQFETREVVLPSNHSVGKCKIANLTPTERSKAVQVMKNEKAPKDGKKNCQDWVINVLLTLMDTDGDGNKKLVPEDTAEIWEGLRGKSVQEIKKKAGDAWTDLIKEKKDKGS